jgi:hypothetical protein
MTTNGPYGPGWPPNTTHQPPGGYGYGPQEPLAYPEHWPPVAARPKASSPDLVLTWTLGIITIGAACLYGLWSLFGLMALDACSVRQCNMAAFGLAYGVGWGGSLTAALLVLLWAPRATRHGRRMWPRAAMGLLVFVVSVATWAALGTAAIPLN